MTDGCFSRKADGGPNRIPGRDPEIHVQNADSEHIRFAFETPDEIKEERKDSDSEQLALEPVCAVYAVGFNDPSEPFSNLKKELVSENLGRRTYSLARSTTMSPDRGFNGLRTKSERTLRVNRQSVS